MYKPHQKKTYLAVGDSTTWTVANDFYASQVTKRMSKDIGTVYLINKGIGGTNSTRLLKLFNQYVSRNQFDIISICVGMNDASNNAVSITLFEQNLGEMVEMIRRSNPRCEIVLVAPPTATEPTRIGNLRTYRDSIRNVSIAKGTLYYSPRTLWTTSPEDSYLFTRQFISSNRYKHRGSWNATTNLTTEIDGSTGKTLVSATSPNSYGDYYRVPAPGTTTLDGISSWAADDAAVWNGIAWKKATPNWSLISPVQNYRGGWNASTNATIPLTGTSAAIVSSLGTIGDWSIVTVAGATTIDTIGTWAVNDVIFFNGTVWVQEKLDWIHPIQEGEDIWANDFYNFLASNSKFYKVGNDSLSRYATIPSAPVFGATRTLAYTDVTTGNIFASNITGFTDVQLSGVWDRLVMNGVMGEMAKKIRITNANGSARLGNSAGAFVSSGCIGSLNNSNYIEFYGKSPSEPLIIENNNNGIQWNPTVIGVDLLVQNVVARNLGFAGALINVGDNTKSYRKIELSYVRVFGGNTEGEVFYIGNTSPTTYSMLNQVIVRNCFGTNKGRDGLQISSTYNLLAENSTFYDVGKTDSPQQNHLLQVANSNGIIRNCIFDKAPRLCNIFAHDLIVENCYFSWDQDTFGYIGDAATTYATFQTGNGKPLIFRNCIFNPTVNVAVMVSVAEKTANIIFENCKFSTRIASLFNDARGAGYTNSLVGSMTTNGNIQLPESSLPRPTYQSLASTDFETHGLNTNIALQKLLIGYRAI